MPYNGHVRIMIRLPILNCFILILSNNTIQGTEQGLIVASNVGRVELSLAYFIKSGTLKVTILRCIDLPEMDNQGSANPFVQV